MFAPIAMAGAISALASAGVIAWREQPRESSAAYAASGRIPKQAPAATATPTASMPVTKSELPANELGRIPILMYHSVGDPPLTGSLAKFNRLGLSIPASLLRKHLETLYAGGFYPVNVRDLFESHFSVPVGKTPVALTFDDARVSQFRYRKDGTIDPNCALGVLEAFHASHPDWPQKATFFVLPASKYNPPPFGIKAQVGKKLNYLVKLGYEVANHSTSHRSMSSMDATTLVWEMKTCTDYIHKFAPQATMDTMALPYGNAPRKALLPILLDDGHGSYHNKCILLAGGNPSYAPNDKRFDKTHVTRIGSEPGNIEGWLRVLMSERKISSKGQFHPYISDGDPDTLTVPKSLEKYVNTARLDGMQVVAYADPPAPKSTAKHESASRKSPKVVAHKQHAAPQRS